MARPSPREASQWRPVSYFVLMFFVVLFALALIGIAPWIQALYASWVGVGVIALVHAEVEPETPQRFAANLKRFLRSHIWPLYMPRNR